VIRNNDGTGKLLRSKQGAAKGYLLMMIAYTIGVLPLIKKLKVEFPTMHQPWYVDDAGVGANFAHIWAMFKLLLELAPDYGYHSEPSKSILVVSRSTL
jgi:hypothetical protein